MKILCFGSLNLDHVYEVDHIVQPGETTPASEYQIFEGGKGLNQAVALGKAGANCSMAGIIGCDGSHLLAFLKKCNVNTDNIVISDKNTGHAIIQVDKSGQNSIIYFAGSNQLVEEGYIKEVLSHFDAGDFVLLQNEISNVPKIIEIAKRKGLKIAFNPSPITDDLCQYPLDMVDILVVNEIEGFELTKEKEPQRIIDKLHEVYPKSNVLLTLGKDGVMFSDGKAAYKHGVYMVEAVDTTAAGDTFVGYFLASYSKGEPIDECLKIASTASAIAVSRKGASPSIPTISEVQCSKLVLR